MEMSSVFLKKSKNICRLTLLWRHDILIENRRWSDGAANAARSGESLVVRSCNEWCDSIDDMLYQLRRVQDFATAQTVAGGELVSLIRRVERLAEDVESQQLGLSPQQLESEPLPKARLKFLQGELRNEVLRLQKAGCYGAAQLTPLLEACLKAARD